MKLLVQRHRPRPSLLGPAGARQRHRARPAGHVQLVALAPANAPRHVQTIHTTLGKAVDQVSAAFCIQHLLS